MKRVLPLLTIALLLLSGPARATWSIVCVDTRTGEVAAASATCIPSFDLETATPVLIVGQGAAVSQALVAPTSVLKDLRSGILAGMTPHAILELYQALPGANDRQVGIATMEGPAVNWTGSGAAPAKPMRAGSLGSIHYAIQGNILVGNPVVTKMEETFLAAPGDLSQKLMEAMQTARRYGGDGRCSCDQQTPNQCSSPPEGFGPDDKSAHVAFMHLARLGDTDGPCNGTVGCSAGDYYLKIKFSGGANADDPVSKLQERYDKWRNELIGRPDHLLSTVSPRNVAMPVGAEEGVEVAVNLVDVEGDVLPGGGVQLRLEPVGERPPRSEVLSIEDGGNGRFVITLGPGSEPGADVYEIWAEDGIRPVRLRAELRVEVTESTGLTVGSPSLSADAPHRVPLWLDLGPDQAHAAYGVTGWSDVGPSAFLSFAHRAANTAVLPAGLGHLDARGRASAAFAPPAALLRPLVGSRIHWLAWSLDPSTGRVHATDTRALEILP